MVINRNLFGWGAMAPVGPNQAPPLVSREVGTQYIKVGQVNLVMAGEQFLVVPDTRARTKTYSLQSIISKCY
jgi:hypothetical protein